MARPDFEVVSRYTGAGNLDTYSFDFLIESEDRILIKEYDEDGVLLNEVRGDDTTFLSSVDFDPLISGGDVILADNLDAGHLLVIMLAPDEPTQESEFKEKYSNTNARIEAALDYITGPIQRLMYLALRAMKLNDYNDIDDFDMSLPAIDQAADGGKLLALNEDADGFALSITTDALLAAEAAAIAAAAAANASAASASADAAAADASFILADASADAALISETAAAASAAAAAASAASLLGFIRCGTENIANGVLFHDVVFTSALASTSYGVTVNIGCSDADPTFLQWIRTTKLTTGFRVIFNTETDSVNFQLEYTVAGHA